MSDEPITQLLGMMRELSTTIRTLVANQEKLAAEQDHAAQSLGELGLIMRNHADILRASQDAIVRLWEASGLPTDEAPPTQMNLICRRWPISELPSPPRRSSSRSSPAPSASMQCSTHCCRSSDAERAKCSGSKFRTMRTER